MSLCRKNRLEAANTSKTTRRWVSCQIWENTGLNYTEQFEEKDHHFGFRRNRETELLIRRIVENITEQGTDRRCHFGRRERLWRDLVRRNRETDDRDVENVLEELEATEDKRRWHWENFKRDLTRGTCEGGADRSLQTNNSSDTFLHETTFWSTFRSGNVNQRELGYRGDGFSGRCCTAS